MNEWKSMLKSAMEAKREREEEVAVRRRKCEVELELFLRDVVRPAFAEIHQEMNKYGRTCQINVSKYGAHLTISQNSAEEYALSLSPTYTDSGTIVIHPLHEFTSERDGRRYQRQGSFRNGVQDYSYQDVDMEELIAYVIAEYTSHLSGRH